MPDNFQAITNYSLFPSSVPVKEDDDDGGSETGSSHVAYADDVTSGQAYCIFISHMLSMWNSRMYEFAVVNIEI